ncbi:hypothetical protein HK097_008206 [Rhizophlyctis rosea]|uniref:EF-hand domain-containing protein n=1 Tax=Rhizophlyctis rosea TaxID=64517 RepID=A0AAD5X8I1_9FUNG|nr:hypothetical protein HK097_008206 [Rhizophlyctis rosea]
MHNATIAPEYHWKISFKLFDFNGDGTVSKDEFNRIMAHHTGNLGALARLGNKQREAINLNETGINKLFFGEKGDKSLTFDQFTDFMRRLNLEILKLEFYQFDVDQPDETISMRDFGYSIISYAPEKRLKSLVERVQNLPDTPERVSFSRFYEFDHMIRTRLHDLGLAYKVYTSMGGGFSRDDFRRIVAAVTRTELTPNQVNLIFDVFDTNQDGHLDVAEFYDEVMKTRHTRGLHNARDTEVTSYFKRVWKCIQDPDRD